MQGIPRLVALALIYWSSIALPVSYGGFKLRSNSVSKDGSPHHHTFSVASQRICEFSWDVSDGAENSGENGRLCLQTFAVPSRVPCDWGKWLVSVEEFILSWSYGPRSGTVKSHEKEACSPGDQNTALVFSTKKPLPMEKITVVFRVLVSACRWALVCTMGQVTGPVSDGALLSTH